MAAPSERLRFPKWKTLDIAVGPGNEGVQDLYRDRRTPNRTPVVGPWSVPETEIFTAPPPREPTVVLLKY